MLIPDDCRCTFSLQPTCLNIVDDILLHLSILLNNRTYISEVASFKINLAISHNQSSWSPLLLLKLHSIYFDLDQLILKPNVKLERVTKTKGRKQGNHHKLVKFCEKEQQINVNLSQRTITTNLIVQRRFLILQYNDLTHTHTQVHINRRNPHRSLYHNVLSS